MEFQKYVTGQKLSMGEILNLLGGEIYKPTEWIGRFRQTEGELRVQIYEDKGQGFSEENSYFPENVYAEEKQAEFTVNFDGNVHYLRLDPAMCACVCKIRELTMNGQPVPVQDKRSLPPMENLKVRRRCGASQRGISHGGSESDDPGGCIGQKGREHPDCENGDRADSPCCGK